MSPSANEYSKAELIAALGAAEVKTIIKNGLIKPTAGKYDLVAAVQACLESFENELPDGVQEEMDAARTTLNDFESAIYETRAQLVSGELFVAETVQRVMIDSLSNVKIKLLATSNRCCRLCIGKKSVDEISARLQEVMDEALIELRPFRKDDFLSRDIDYAPQQAEIEEEED